MRVEIANMVMEYGKRLDADSAKDLLMATILPLVCVVIEDLIKEGKIKLC